MAAVSDRGSTATPQTDPWDVVPAAIQEQGLRWTSQRRTLVAVLRDRHGHVTVPELLERCREVDQGTTPSTLYRTLDVFERLGLVLRCHAPDGHEEFRVLPHAEHAHLYCAGCGTSWEVEASELQMLVDHFERTRGFDVDLPHVTINGRCTECRRRQPPAGRRQGRLARS